MIDLNSNNMYLEHAVKFNLIYFFQTHCRNKRNNLNVFLKHEYINDLH